MQFVLTLHSITRWAVLLFGVWTLINAITGVTGKRSFTAADNRSNLLFMISCDIQLLIGLILYFGNGWFDKLKNFSQYKSDTFIRFFSMEHATMMILAWILVHIGRASVKKAGADAAKHKKMLLFFGLALLLILASIPWPFRSALGKGWI
jgi:hypothetical protein